MYFHCSGIYNSTTELESALSPKSVNYGAAINNDIFE